MSETAIDRTAAYRQAGVDLELSNSASQVAATASQSTWGNRAGEFGEPVSFDGDFSSSKRLTMDEIRERPEVDAVFSMDGTGTKPNGYARMGTFEGLGRDLIAAAVDDIPVEGGQPVLVNNTLIVNSVAQEFQGRFHELFQGLVAGANEAGVSLATGETAVHSDLDMGYGDFHVDWVADAMGLVLRERHIDGSAVSEGDELWGFAQTRGFRCNGISAVRKAFEQEYGNGWHREKFHGSTLGAEAIAPSTIYSGLMNSLTGGYKREVEPKAHIHGAAHITGGGIPEKVGRMLRASGLGAFIDEALEPPPIMLHAQQVTTVVNPDYTKREMTDEEMYSTWCGGTGYVIAISPEDAAVVDAEAEKFGIIARKIGKVVARPGIRLHSWGWQTTGRILEF